MSMKLNANKSKNTSGATFVKSGQSVLNNTNTLRMTNQMSKSGAPSGAFPTDLEIEQFQAQLSLETIRKLATSFKNHFTTLKQKILPN